MAVKVLCPRTLTPSLSGLEMYAPQVNDYHIIKEVGRGAFAVVKLARIVDKPQTALPSPKLHAKSFVVRFPIAVMHCCIIGRFVSADDTMFQAIKVFSKSALRCKREFVSVAGHRFILSALDKAHEELAIMKKVRHHNIISCYEIIDEVDGDGLYLGMSALPSDAYFLLKAQLYVFMTACFAL